MSDLTREQVVEAWDSVKGIPGLMGRLRRGERIIVPIPPRIADLAGAAGIDYDKPREMPRIEFSGRFERFDEGGSFWVVRSGWHVVATEWVTGRVERSVEFTQPKDNPNP